MGIRALQDNVIVRFTPRPEVTAGGLFIPQTASKSRIGVREAEVLAVGPGHHRDGGFGAFIPTTVRVGDTVLVDEVAGQDYSLDNYRPRQNKGSELADARGELRIVREDEIHAVVEPG